MITQKYIICGNYSKNIVLDTNAFLLRSRSVRLRSTNIRRRSTGIRMRYILHRVATGCRWKFIVHRSPFTILRSPFTVLRVTGNAERWTSADASGRIQTQADVSRTHPDESGTPPDGTRMETERRADAIGTLSCQERYFYYNVNYVWVVFIFGFD